MASTYCCPWHNKPNWTFNAFNDFPNLVRGINCNPKEPQLHVDFIELWAQALQEKLITSFIELRALLSTTEREFFWKEPFNDS